MVLRKMSHSNIQQITCWGETPALRRAKIKVSIRNPWICEPKNVRIFTLLKSNIFHTEALLQMMFPFPQVGSVSSTGKYIDSVGFGLHPVGGVSHPDLSASAATRYPTLLVGRLLERRVLCRSVTNFHYFLGNGRHGDQWFQQAKKCSLCGWKWWYFDACHQQKCYLTIIMVMKI